MANSTDRVAELLEARRCRMREITTPEGVVIDVEVADRGERLFALIIDMTIWLVATILLTIAVLIFFIKGSDVMVTVATFVSFLLRNLYFILFELAWQGATPGKRLVGIRVIDRKGGVLTPGTVVARNLTREVEIFLPLQIYLSVGAASGPETFWQNLTMLAWVMALAALPMFNRDHLRAGDMIAGTLVIAMPRRVLDVDLVTQSARESAYAFTSAQLQSYGVYELQVLEDMLRRPRNSRNDDTLADIANRISNRIGWTRQLAPGEVRSFLQAFYASQRAELERGQLFGRFRASKTSGTQCAQNTDSSGLKRR